MKNVLIVMMLIATTYLCAIDLDDNFHFGIKGGLQNSVIKGDGIETRKPRMSFTGDVFMIKAINHGFYLMNSIRYQPIGAIDENDVKYRLDYVSTNLFICYALPEDLKQNTVISPFVGIDFGILAKDKISYLGEDVDIKDLSKTNISLSGGFNVISKENIIVSFIYNYGLTKIVDNDDFKDRFNRSMTFTLGYMFK